MVAQEEASVNVISPRPAKAASVSSFLWIPFWIISAIVGILGVLLIWLPSLKPCPLGWRGLLMIVQRQNKLWGLKTNNTIVPEGGDVCQRVPGCVYLSWVTE